MTTWGWLFNAFWLFLPAGIANMTPPIANKISWLKNWQTPMDFGKSWHGKRLLGPNKRWRGLVCGVVAAGITSSIQYAIVHGQENSLGYFVIAFLVGAIIGYGALLGDAVASFFKRQRGILSGQPWFVFDQIDYIIGGLLFAWPFLQITWAEAVTILVLYFGLHLIISFIGFKLGFKETAI